jgi:hypothetical protein
VVAVEEVEFAAPFKFYRDEPRSLLLEARFGEDGQEVVAACRLLGSRELPGRPEPQVTTHLSAQVRLGRHPSDEPTGELIPPPLAPATMVDAADIYRVYFHGPAYQVLERAWTDGGRVIGLMAAGLPDAHSPAELPLLTNPRLVELCFQTAGVWELGTTGRLALPSRIARLTFYGTPDIAAATRFETLFLAMVTPRDGGFDADVIDSRGRLQLSLRGYQTIALPSAIDDRLLAPFRAALGDRT